MKEQITTPITRYRDGKLVREQNPVAVEITLTFVVNGHEIAALMCTPSHLKAFTYGFLFTSGIIRNARDIASWHLDEAQWVVDVTVPDFSGSRAPGRPVFTPGFGKGVMYLPESLKEASPGPACHAGVSAPELINAMDWLIKCSDLHQQTGGVHSAAVSAANAIPKFHIDDVGRHNAVDKVIGTLIMKEIQPDNLVLLGTGRISSEILYKAARMGIPVLASRGAPTQKTILLAEESGITVAGFVRPGNFAIFTHPHRIITT